MSTDTAEVWHHVREVRVDLADRVEGFDPEQAATPSLCEGWRVRDVVGHLVHLAEATQLSIARDVARNGPSPQRGVTLAATDVTWQTGSGPAVEGPALELLLLLAGRRAPLRDLRGPGLGRVGGGPAPGPVVDPPR